MAVVGTRTRNFQEERPVSKLVMLQARFQQKQLQEKEEKLLKLYNDQRERALERVGNRVQSGGSSDSTSSSSSVGVGKVRCMFRARRGNADPRHGRDKSYPLEPIASERAPPVRTRSLEARRPEPTPPPPPIDRRPPKLLYFGQTEPDYFGDELDFNQSFHVVDDFKIDYSREKVVRYQDRDEFFMKSFNNKRQFYENRLRENSAQSEDYKISKKLSNVGLDKSFTMNDQKKSNENQNKYKTYVSASGINKKNQIASVLPAKSGLPLSTRQKEAQTNGNCKSPTRKTTPMPSPPSLQIQKQNQRIKQDFRSEVPPCPVPANRTTVPRSSSGKLTATAKSQGIKMPATKPTPNPDLVNCRICGRHFANDRVAKHESICQKSTNSKRKVFDTLQQRVRGTEAEKYLKKGAKINSQTIRVPRSLMQTNWRKKHEDFINSIRAAKEMQAHLKKGGKLSDLPPPPPSDYSDYVPCPHCGRKFNQAAADRHIPKCANMIHNKPNPGIQKKAPTPTPNPKTNRSSLQSNSTLRVRK